MHVHVYAIKIVLNKKNSFQEIGFEKLTMEKWVRLLTGNPKIASSKPAVIKMFIFFTNSDYKFPDLV